MNFSLIRYILLINIIFFLGIQVQGQFLQSRKVVRSNVAFASLNTSKYGKVVDYLPRNYKVNGNINYTKYVQKAINENANLVFPDFPILVTGLKLKSNSTLYFNPQSQLIIEPTNKDYYAGLLIDNITNVKIYNLNIKGDRNNHRGKGGEHGFGVEIKNSRNVLLENFHITECWGDGIIIDDRPEKNRRTSNITLKGGLLDYNRRDGISIISGNNINIYNISIYNTMGTNPMAGIMIEPNHSGNTLGKINIRNVLLDNNVIGLGMNFDNYFDGGVHKTIDLNVSDVRVNNSSIGISIVSGRNEKYLKQVIGNIIGENVRYSNNKFNVKLPKNSHMIPNILGF